MLLAFSHYKFFTVHGSLSLFLTTAKTALSSPNFLCCLLLLRIIFVLL